MNKVIRAGGKLMAATAVAQVLGILALPTIARFYPPSEFGIYSAWLVPVGLAVIVVNLQFQHALVLPKIESHAFGLFAVAQTSTVLGALLVGLGTFVYLRIFGDNGVGLYFFPVFVGFAVLSSATHLLLQGLAVRKGKFGSMAGASLFRTVFSVAIQLLMGKFNVGATGLLIGYAAGEAGGAAMLWYQLKIPMVGMHVRNNLTWRRALIRRHSDFLRFTIPMEFLNSASQGIPVILIGFFFGQSSAGSFAFAVRIMLAPVQLITNSLRPVFYKKMADSVSAPSRQFLDFKRTVFLLGVLPVVAAIAMAPFLADFFTFIFGEKWREAGGYAGCLVFWAALLVSNMPATLVFRVLRKQQWSFRFNVSLMVARFAVLVFGGYVLDAYWTVVGFSFVAVAANIIYIFIAYKLLRARSIKG